MRWVIGVGFGLALALACSTCAYAFVSTTAARIEEPDEIDVLDDFDWDRCTAGTTSLQRFAAGAAHRRRCVVATLTRLQDDVEPELAEVRPVARELAEFYAARSERNQSIVDGSAGTTGIGALGYALSGPAGAVTQSYWGYAALAPILLVQFNANEPTKDLFFAAYIAASLITDRYNRLENRLDQLSEVDASIDCAHMDALHREVVNWPAGDNKTATLPVATAMARRCRDIRYGNLLIDEVLDNAELRRDFWPRSYAKDMIGLEIMVRERDAALRTTPSQALTMLVSTPLRALDTLVSGQNAQAAIDTIRVQNALSNLGFTLTDVMPSYTVSTIATPYLVPAEVAGRIDLPAVAARSQSMGQAEAGAYDPGGMASRLIDFAEVMELARIRYNSRVLLAQELLQAVDAKALSFAYNAQSRRADVSLRTVAAAAAAQQQALAPAPGTPQAPATAP